MSVTVGKLLFVNGLQNCRDRSSTIIDTWSPLPVNNSNYTLFILFRTLSPLCAQYQRYVFHVLPARPVLHLDKWRRSYRNRRLFSRCSQLVILSYLIELFSTSKKISHTIVKKVILNSRAASEKQNYSSYDWEKNNSLWRSVLNIEK